ncbi:MAG: ABC transporter C-terminal domain-containing protein [Rhodospirillales bacterium]|nr:ABC transporter C-terminal domain-containing protein [Rhodospirillales bacterium]
MKFRELRHLPVVALVAVGLALAGCGGGGDGSLSTSEEQQQQQDHEMAVAALQATIAELRTALGLDPEGDDDPDVTVAELQATITDLRGQLEAKEDAERMAEEEAARMAAAATGKALFAALEPPEASVTPQNALGNATAALGPTGLTITAANGAGAIPDGTTPGPVTLKAGDSAGSLGSWNGTMYGHTNTGTKVVNAAVVYNNKGPGRTRTLAQAGITVFTGTTSGTDVKGHVYIVASDGTFQTGFTAADVMAPAFTHSGTQTHTYDSDTVAAFTTRGMLKGAPGTFRCTGACTSENDGKGSPSAMTGTWHFMPDAGAMAHEADAHYLYYGWWVSKDKDGDPTAASAFVGRAGTEPGNSTDGLDLAGNGADLTGSATYAGHAAGKFALDYSQNAVLDGASDGGHFTADATLSATFGGGATAGLTGTIDNFRLNDSSEDPGWSVSLMRRTWAADGATGQPTDNADTANVDESAVGTVWSMGGTSAEASGTWTATMYDEKPGNPPGGDGSNLPTTATGTFYTQYDDVGRMVGAFGADRQ